VPEFGETGSIRSRAHESMRLSEDEGWAPDVADRQSAWRRPSSMPVGAALIGSPKQQPKRSRRITDSADHLGLAGCPGAPFPGRRGEAVLANDMRGDASVADRTERNSSGSIADWSQSRGAPPGGCKPGPPRQSQTDAVREVDTEVTFWGEPHPYAGGARRRHRNRGLGAVIYRLEQEIPGGRARCRQLRRLAPRASWVSTTGAPTARAAQQFERMPAPELRLDDLEPPEER